MNNKVLDIFMFTVGAAIGSAVTWKFVKTKYERIADEEIKSVKERFRLRSDPTYMVGRLSGADFDGDYLDTGALRGKREDVHPVDDAKKPEMNYAEVVKSLGYNKEEGESDMSDEPYIISPDEFGENNDYDVISLTYYADGIVTDECDTVMDKDELKESIGEGFASHFGEYEEDSVFVRNDEQACDYEILKDQRKYSDTVEIPPYPEG